MAEETNSKQARTVAISRQKGSGGAYVGRAVADRLSLLFIDREMLRNASEYFSAREAEQNPDPLESKWWSRLGQSLSFGGLDYGYVPPSSEAIYEGEIFGIENRLMQEIVEGHPAVIVGRGAAQTLREHAGVLSIFLHAPEAWRVTRVQQIYSIEDRRAAERMVRESDRDRARFVKSIADTDWKDARCYDLAIDTAALGLDTTVDLIVRAVGVRVT